MPVVVKILDSPHRQADAEERAAEQREKTTNDRWLVGFTGALFVVTLVLAVFTGNLWLSTGALVGDAKQTAERQLRAYVSIKVTGYAPAGERVLYFTTRMKNRGTTPAFDVTLTMNRAVLPFPLEDIGRLEDKPDPDPHPALRIVLHPGMRSNGSSSQFLPPISETDMAAVNQSTIGLPHPPQLYCFGTVRYNDIFGRNHWAHYCAVFGGDLKRASVGKPWLTHLYNDTGTDALPVLTRRQRFAAWTCAQAYRLLD